VAGVAFATGVWLMAATGIAVAIGSTALVLSLLGAWSVTGRRWARRTLPFALLLLAGSCRLGALNEVWPSHHLKYRPESASTVTVFGVVVAEPDVRPRKTFLHIAVDSVASASRVVPRTGKLLVRLRYDPHLGYGDAVAMRGRLQRPEGRRNPGEFDYAAYLARRDIHARLSPRGREAVIARTPAARFTWIGSVIAPLRGYVNERLGRHLTGEPAALVLGLLFGERKVMSQATVKAFEVTGTLHLLAVSGSNVGVVIAVVWGFATFMRIPKLLRTAISLVALVLFCYLAHNEASVVRASVAGAVILVGRALRRPTDPLNVWGAALLLLLMYDPRQLFEVGFQLSFAATMGILLCFPAGTGGRGQRSWLMRAWQLLALAAGVSVAAQLAVMPILAGAFGRVPLVTPLSNLLCVPLAGLATAAGLVTLLLSPLGGWPLAVLSAATWLFAQALLWSVNLFFALDFPVPALAVPGWAPTLLYYVACGLAYAWFRVPRLRRRILFGGLVLLNLVLGVEAIRPEDPLRVMVLDCGTESVSLLRWPSGEVWRIASAEGIHDSRTAVIVAGFLSRHGWRRPLVDWPLESDLTDPGGETEGTPSGPFKTLMNSTLGSIDEVRGSPVHVVVYPGEPLSTVRGMRVRSGQAGLIWLADARLATQALIDLPATAVIVPQILGLPIPAVAGAPRFLWIESAHPPRRRQAEPPGPGVQILRTVSDGGISLSLRDGEMRAEASTR
jgi:competence protein ComEC